MSTRIEIRGRVAGGRLRATAAKAQLRAGDGGRAIHALQPVGALAQGVPRAALVAAPALGVGPITIEGSGSQSIPVTYSSAFVDGQIVYVDDGIAYPVTRNMQQAVTKLLAQVTTTGSAGARHEVLIDGVASSSVYALASGAVFLGDDGFPVAAGYGESGNYVPLGFGPGGDSFNFAPQGRYLRS